MFNKNHVKCIFYTFKVEEETYLHARAFAKILGEMAV